ncbi:transcriptional regulator (plasmid) [Latilactobacillus curvatus]|uniref:helix-turn-helix domain-containing protein n=1 Tax=Latilactobacillus curvatus TaxID=28038 RepID=UPI000F7CFF21|nr:helix-turn-helix domain-containing protein [Latilactobacillus curvatus]AZP95496.1 transcriptional regulator [Latilactobacillus curvatus]
MDLSQQLKTSRQNAGLSQTKVAEQLHISRQAISQWENGKNYPDLDNLILLSQLYHFNLNELLAENTELREKLAINEHQIKIETKKLNQVNTQIEKTKDEGLILLILSCLLFVIAPLGIFVAPIIMWRNKRLNTFYKIIYLVCIIAILYNAYIGYSTVLNYFNWGVTSYY